jgi:23S rRNA pseudouridine1911/1915/1917 synthase
MKTEEYKDGPLATETAPLADEAALDGEDAAPEWRSGAIHRSLHGTRLDKALVALAPEFSRSHLQRLLEAGHVRLDGAPAQAASQRVKSGQQLAVELVPTDESKAFRPQPMALKVLHEDEHLLVLDKPAGLVVHPAPGHWQGTLLNGLLAHHAGASLLPRAGIVHRLDKDTSGVMVVARTPLAHAAVVRALAAREVGREYLALCQGRLTGGGTVDEPIGRHRTQRTRMAVRPDGREAVTHYRIERRLREHTLVRATLETGRTHQIRVHLAHVGHPVVGDPVYGGRKRLPRGASPTVIAALGAFRRQALHAARLVLAHPTTGRELAFEAPLPEDFAALLAVLEDDAR